jgi:hypothetical protein
MTKSEFIDIMSKKWDVLEALQKNVSFYDYEKEFDEFWVSSGRDVLEAGINTAISDRRKKKKLKPVMVK